MVNPSDDLHQSELGRRVSTDGPSDDRTGRTVLTVDGLHVDFRVDGTWYPAVKDVSFTLGAGEVLSIVGESGSGKSTIAMSLVGLLPKTAQVRGSILVGERQVVGATERAMRQLRGEEVAVIFQEPRTALNPVYTIGFQIMEMLRAHTTMTHQEAHARAVELLRIVEIPEPERRMRAYPYQLSGGQCQRVMIAQSLACDPKILLADEPTTALDVTVQAEILRLIRSLKDRINASVVLITHDMGVVADMADRILVMKDGQLVEGGTPEAIFYAPREAYTQALLSAVPHLGAVVGSDDDRAAARTMTGEVAVGRAVDTSEPAAKDGGGSADQRHRSGPVAGSELVVDLHGVAVDYPRRGRTPAFRAVHDFDLQIGAGEVVGLVGESGSGKTTIGWALVGLLPFMEGTADVLDVDLRSAGPRAMRDLRKNLSMVFQDPGSSLNPRLSIGESISEPLRLHKIAKGQALARRVEDLLDQVQLDRSMRNRFPHELSGGQRQRVSIARALALSPSLLIADEPTSALDVSVQASVLELFQELQREGGFACLFITHDLAVVEILAHRVAVMHRGNLVESGTTEQILTDPLAPYTQRLLAAVPVPDPEEQAVRRRHRDELLTAGVNAAG